MQYIWPRSILDMLKLYCDVVPSPHLQPPRTYSAKKRTYSRKKCFWFVPKLLMFAYPFIALSRLSIIYLLLLKRCLFSFGMLPSCTISCSTYSLECYIIMDCFHFWDRSEGGGGVDRDKLN